jgi:glycosyltransferase involved in cell wall biosynthesis
MPGRVKAQYKPLLQLAVGIVCIFLLVHLLKYFRFLYRMYYKAKSYLHPSYTPSPVLEEDRQTFTWLIHMYPPVHNAGAEWMAHAMNKYLLESAGCSVNVVLNRAKVSEFERVRIIDKKSRQQVESSVTHCSAILSHLDMEVAALHTAVQAKRPLVIVMHNNYRKPWLQEYIRMMPKNLYLINNSKWLQEYYSLFNIPSIVVYPPVYWQEYHTETTREYVTLINLNKNKGGDVLIQIAKAMPNVKFMGVNGGYDGQIEDRKVKNIEYTENTAYIKGIYAKTGILLVPSKEESWGRVAIEAMSSGIPVIAHPTPGLLESCGSAGIFCKRDDTAAWVREIRRLKEDKAYYAEKSAACLARAKELDPKPQLEAMSKWLLSLRWRN